jgi:hypothetical protein
MIASRSRRMVALVAAALVTASVQPSAPAAAGALSVWQPEGGTGLPALSGSTASINSLVFDAGKPTDAGKPGGRGKPTDPSTPTDPASPADPPTLPVSSDPPVSTPPVSSDPPVSTPPVSSDPPVSTPPVSSDPPVSTPPVSSDPPVSTPPVSSDPPVSTPPVSSGPPVSTPPASTPPPSDSPPHHRPPPDAGGSTGGVAPKHPKHTPKPHPHKTLRPKKPARTAPGVRRPHPHRKPWPITMTLKTVPALAGVHFTVDGRQLVTGANGMASYTAEHDFTAHRLSVLSSSVTTADKRFQFNRWAGQRDPNQAFSRTVSGLPMRSNYVVTAAFSVQSQVTPRVVRQDGTPLNPGEVKSITARSDNGSMVSLPLTAPIWLDATRPTFHHSVLAAEPVTYSLQTVMVRGTNVVDAGRQTFTPAVTVTPTFTTQFHDLVITGHDAIFKSRLGTTATVTFPDGGKLTVPLLGSEHTATLTNLPRGNYKVTLQAGRAIVGVQQFGLSKDKTADLIVISALDLAILVGLLLMIAVVLLVIGRQYWRRLVNRPRRERDVVVSREKILT